MDFIFYINIVYIFLFFIFAFIWFQILRDMNLEKYFKQGRVRTIQVFFILSAFLLSFVTSFSIRYLLVTVYNIFINL